VLCIVAQSEQSCLDLGPVVVGTVAYRHLTVANDSICDLQYKLLVEQFVSGSYGDDELLHDDDDGTLGMNSIRLGFSANHFLHRPFPFLPD